MIYNDNQQKPETDRNLLPNTSKDAFLQGFLNERTHTIDAGFLNLERAAEVSNINYSQEQAAEAIDRAVAVPSPLIDKSNIHGADTQSPQILNYDYLKQQGISNPQDHLLHDAYQKLDRIYEDSK
jgi:hypothetical protein